MDILQQKILATELLNCSMEDVEENSGLIEELGVLYVSVPTKDGVSLLIDTDGSVLLANSSISYSTLISDFLAGQRTPREFFFS